MNFGFTASLAASMFPSFEIFNAADYLEKEDDDEDDNDCDESCTDLFNDSAMILYPLRIKVRRRGMHDMRLAKWHQDVRLQPFVSLHVAIGKRKPAATIMIARRIISHPIRIARPDSIGIAGVAHVHAERAVIDGVAAFVRGDVNIGGRQYLLEFAENLISIAAAMQPEPGQGGIHAIVHGNAPDKPGHVGRTFVDSWNRDVSGQCGLLRVEQQSGVGAVEGIAHISSHPILENRYLVAVLVAIHCPGHSQLLVIIHALRPLCGRLGMT